MQSEAVRPKTCLETKRTSPKGMNPPPAQIEEAPQKKKEQVEDLVEYQVMRRKNLDMATLVNNLWSQVPLGVLEQFQLPKRNLDKPRRVEELESIKGEIVSRAWNWSESQERQGMIVLMENTMEEENWKRTGNLTTHEARVEICQQLNGIVTNFDQSQVEMMEFRMLMRLKEEGMPIPQSWLISVQRLLQEEVMESDLTTERALEIDWLHQKVVEFQIREEIHKRKGDELFKRYKSQKKKNPEQHPKRVPPKYMTSSNPYWERIEQVRLETIIGDRIRKMKNLGRPSKWELLLVAYWRSMVLSERTVPRWLEPAILVTKNVMKQAALNARKREMREEWMNRVEVINQRVNQTFPQKQEDPSSIPVNSREVQVGPNNMLTIKTKFVEDIWNITSQKDKTEGEIHEELIQRDPETWWKPIPPPIPEQVMRRSTMRKWDIPELVTHEELLKHSLVMTKEEETLPRNVKTGKTREKLQPIEKSQEPMPEPMSIAPREPASLIGSVMRNCEREAEAHTQNSQEAQEEECEQAAIAKDWIMKMEFVRMKLTDELNLQDRLKEEPRLVYHFMQACLRAQSGVHRTDQHRQLEKLVSELAEEVEKDYLHEKEPDHPLGATAAPPGTPNIKEGLTPPVGATPAKSEGMMIEGAKWEIPVNENLWTDESMDEEDHQNHQ